MATEERDSRLAAFSIAFLVSAYVPRVKISGDSEPLVSAGDAMNDAEVDCADSDETAGIRRLDLLVAIVNY